MKFYFHIFQVQFKLSLKIIISRNFEIIFSNTCEKREYEEVVCSYRINFIVVYLF